METEQTTATIIETPEGEPNAVVVELPETGVENATGSEAVAIAQIEGDTQVTIAAINAETEQARIEAMAARDEELTQARERISWLESQMTNMEEQNRLAQEQIAALTPPPLPEVEPVAIAVLDPETLTDTLETPQETSSSTETEHQSESEAESPAQAEAAATGVILPGATLKRTLRFL
jgi:hypothetical protein